MAEPYYDPAEDSGSGGCGKIHSNNRATLEVRLRLNCGVFLGQRVLGGRGSDSTKSLPPSGGSTLVGELYDSHLRFLCLL